MLGKLRSVLWRTLEIILLLLMVTLSVVVIVAVCYRIAGDSLSWYDEVASILLAWITYYGAALAALQRKHVGFVRGGLAMVNIGVSLFFAEISSSTVTDVAAMGSIMISEMKKRGYTPAFAAAVTSSSASLAIIIPPSIPMILYASSANTSVEQLFVAGFVPGLIGALGLMGVAYYFAVRYDFPVEEAFNLKRLRTTFIDALPTLMMPVIILGGIFGGFVTATEAAGLAVLAAILIGLWYREVDFKQLYRAMLDGGMQTAVVIVLLAASVLMGGFLTRAQMPQDLAAQLLSITDNKYIMLLILNVFFLLIGCFLCIRPPPSSWWCRS